MLAISGPEALVLLVLLGVLVLGLLLLALGAAFAVRLVLRPGVGRSIRQPPRAEPNER